MSDRRRLLLHPRQLVHKRDVGLLRLILTHVSQPFPGVVLGFSYEVEAARFGDVARSYVSLQGGL